MAKEPAPLATPYEPDDVPSTGAGAGAGAGAGSGAGVCAGVGAGTAAGAGAVETGNEFPEAADSSRVGKTSGVPEGTKLDTTFTTGRGSTLAFAAASTSA